MNNNQRDLKPNVIETASATTSPDNSNSGSFAYILAGVVSFVVIVASIAMGVGLSTVIALAANDASHQSINTMSYINDYDDYNNMQDFNELFDYYNMNEFNGGNGYGTGNSHQNATGSADVADVLDFSLAPYNANIDGELSASSYAGAPNDLRDFVRSFVAIDDDYTNQVVTLLHEAARSESARVDNIKGALTLCDDAAKAFNELQIPELSKSNDQVATSLELAKTAAASRWTALHDELALLDTTEQVDTKTLWELDDKVYDATTQAATYLAEAMEHAARG